MAVNARNKGKSGEYEVIDVLQGVMDEVFAEFNLKAPTLRRNTEQYADGGVDIAGTVWYAVEVKRCEKLDLGKWWLQTLGQSDRAFVELPQFEPLPAGEKYLRAPPVVFMPYHKQTQVDKDVSASGFGGKIKKIPLLFYRQNRAPWRVMMQARILPAECHGLAASKVTMPVDIAYEAFVVWFRLDLRSRLMALGGLKAHLSGSLRG